MSEENNRAATVDDELLRVLARLLGTLFPGSGGLAGLAMPLVKAALGMSNDPVFGGTMYAPNNRAAMNNLYGRLVSDASGGMYKEFQRQANERLIRDLYGVVYDREGFEKLQQERPELQDITYEQFLDTRSKPGGLVSLAMSLLDPTGAAAIKDPMAGIIQTLSRQGRAYGRRGTESLSDAMEVARAVFFDEDGVASFKSSDFSGFSQESVAKLAENIVQSSNLIGEADRGDTTRLRDVGNRLREKLKAYTEALEPLKQFFGDDIRQTLNLIEGISGRRIGTMGKRSVELAADMITAGFEGGGFDAQSLVTTARVTSMVQSELGVRPFERGNTAMHAIRAEGAMAPEYSVGLYERDEERQNIRTSTILQRSAPMVNVLAQAYALWDDRNKSDNEGLDITQRAHKFREEFFGHMAKGMSHDQAAMTMAGVSHMSELYKAYALEGYSDIKGTSYMADMNQDIYLREKGTRGMFVVLQSPAMQEIFRKHAQRFERDPKASLLADLFVQSPEVYKLASGGADDKKLLKAIGKAPERYHDIDSDDIRAAAERRSKIRNIELIDELFKESPEIYALAKRGASDEELLKAIGRTSERYHDINSDDIREAVTGSRPISMREAVERTATRLDELFGESPEVLTKIQQGASDEELAETIRTTAPKYSDIDARLVRAVGHYTMDKNPDYVTQKQIQRSLLDQRTREDIYKEEKEYTAKYRETDVATSIKEYTMSFLRSGGDVDELKKRMFSPKVELQNINKTRTEQLESYTQQVEKHLSSIKDESSKWAEEERRTYSTGIASTIDWAMTGKGLASTTAQKALRELHEQRQIAQDKSRPKEERAEAEARAEKAFITLQTERAYGAGAYEKFVEAEVERLRPYNHDTNLTEEEIRRSAEKTVGEELSSDMRSGRYFSKARAIGDRLTAYLAYESEETKKHINEFAKSIQAIDEDGAVSYERFAMMDSREVGRQLDAQKKEALEQGYVDKAKSLEVLQTQLGLASAAVGTTDPYGTASKGLSDIFAILSSSLPKLVSLIERLLEDSPVGSRVQAKQ